MDIIGSILQYWEFVSSLVSVIALGIVFYLTKTFVKREDCGKCREELEAHCAASCKDLEGRCHELESAQQGHAAGRAAMAEQLTAMPKASDVHDLKVAIERLAGDIRTVQAQMVGQGDMLKAVKNQGDRMNAYLLEKR